MQVFKKKRDDNKKKWSKILKNRIFYILLIHEFLIISIWSATAQTKQKLKIREDEDREKIYWKKQMLWKIHNFDNFFFI